MVRSRIAWGAGFAAAALALTVAGTSATLAADSKLKVVLGYLPNVEMYGPKYALTEGLYKAEGLDVTQVPGGQGIDQVQMVASGVADVGLATGNAIILGAAKGEDFAIIGATLQNSPSAMTCRKDSGVTEPDQLKGKRVGVKTAGRPFFEIFMAKNNLKESDMVVSGIGGGDIAQIIAGQLDCMITTFVFNEPFLINKAGVPVNVLPLSKYGMDASADVYFVKKSFVADEANREALVKLLHADATAWETFLKDPTAAAKYVIDKGFLDGLDLDQQTYQAEQQAAFMKTPLTAEKGILWVNPATFATNAQYLYDAKLASNLVDVTKMIDTSILEKVAPPKY
jgi:NitT/TauT family transport system substrate-binding protein